MVDLKEIIHKWIPLLANNTTYKVIATACLVKYFVSTKGCKIGRLKNNQEGGNTVKYCNSVWLALHSEF